MRPDFDLLYDSAPEGFRDRWSLPASPARLGELLRASDIDGAMLLSRIFPQNGPDPDMLWYPSAGNDYRVKAPARGTVPDLNDLLYTIGGKHTDYCS